MLGRRIVNAHTEKSPGYFADGVPASFLPSHEHEMHFEVLHHASLTCPLTQVPTRLAETTTGELTVAAPTQELSADIRSALPPFPILAATLHSHRHN